MGERVRWLSRRKTFPYRQIHKSSVQINVIKDLHFRNQSSWYFRQLNSSLASEHLTIDCRTCNYMRWLGTFTLLLLLMLCVCVCENACIHKPFNTSRNRTHFDPIAINNNRQLSICLLVRTMKRRSHWQSCHLFCYKYKLYGHQLSLT